MIKEDDDKLENVAKDKALRKIQEKMKKKGIFLLYN